jgi:phage protein D
MLLTPAYQIVIGDRKVNTAEEPRASTVDLLIVDLDMNTPADSVELRLGNVGGLRPERDDDATIELGYLDEEELTPVFAGKVVCAEPNLHSTRVVALSPAQALLESRMEQTFEFKTAGEIIEELAAEAGVTVAQAEPGTLFPAYVIDGRRSLYGHMREIADTVGYDLYFDPSGELVFRRTIFSTRLHVYEWAKQIIELELRDCRPEAESVESWGESPGTGRGENAWAWLSKDTSGSKGTAGSGTPARLVENPVLRTGEAAQLNADATLSRLQSDAVQGRLRTFGRPQVQLGDSIRIREVPDERANGDFRVRAVRHRIDKKTGFTTEIGFRRIA